MAIFAKVLDVLTQIQHHPSFTQNGDFAKGYSLASTSIFSTDKEKIERKTITVSAQLLCQTQYA